jgi:hypothetical protein
MKKTDIFKSIFFVAVAIAFYSCGSPKKDVEPSKPQPDAILETIEIPNFDQNKALEWVKKQVAFGPRVPNSAGHQQCGDFLIKTLQSLADTLVVQKATVVSFDEKQLKIRNIIASFDPENESRIMLCAHWDSRPFSDQDASVKTKPIPGANDGGSGVAVLLEIARLLKAQKPRIGVDIILFDAEDYGQPDGMLQQEKADSYCLGSQYWAKNLHQPNYLPRFGILLDMVGGPNATFTREGGSVQNAPDVVQKVWNAGNRIGYGNNFVNDQTRAIIDDHYYINNIAKIPTIDIIQCDRNTSSNFYKYWHTLQDTPENLDAGTLKAVGQTLLEVVFQEK